MARPDAIEAIRATCEPILARRGVDLLDVSLGHEAGRRLLRLTVEKLDHPLSVDEIAEISEEVSRALDLENPIEGHYTLEVSSPGIERPLFRPSDYLRFAGREIRVRLTEPIEGRRNFRGTIARAGEESFVLQADDSVVEVPYVAVATARLTVDWAEELKGRPLLDGSRP